ncbi:MAG: CRISPR-associated endonuclease Cas1 [Syntrophorhabdus sp.]|jgi:CRISPR-associated protein Cas1|nr:CRISPR-associated endonuclease Cas1 [Syntrophorhabdus sp.]
MGTLYIDRKDIRVKLDGNALAFYAGSEREGMVPIAPLKRVVIVGNIALEASVLNRLADQDITVLFLSGRSNRFHGMLHGRLHNNGLLRIRQYEKSLSSFAQEYSIEVVQGKVSGQTALLKHASQRRPDLRFPLTSAIDILHTHAKKLSDLSFAPLNRIEDSGQPDRRAPLLQSLVGLEGSASAAYFSAYTKLFPPALGFKGRNRRPPLDPVNAVLSLCYTMLHYETVGAIETIGLDPTIGFLHQFEYGRESLACDLVEIHRPAVDEFVWELFRERNLTHRDFTYEKERPGCYLKKDSRKRFYPWYETWAKTHRRHLADSVGALARRIMDGENPLPE